MRITRKGYYEVYAPDGTYISRHTSRDESYEAITEHGQNGKYRITCPDREVEVALILAGPTSGPPPVSDYTPTHYVAPFASVSGASNDYDDLGASSWSSATSESTPTTLGTAMARAVAGNQVECDVGVIVGPPTGPVDADFAPTNAGTSGNPIIFFAKNPAASNYGTPALYTEVRKPLFDGASMMTNNNYVIFDGFFFDEDQVEVDGNAGIVRIADGVTGCEVRRCAFYRSGTDTYADDYNANLIYLDHTIDAVITDCYFDGKVTVASHNNGHINLYNSANFSIKNNYFTDSYFTIFIKENGDQPGGTDPAPYRTSGTISYNHIYECNVGITTQQGNSLTIEHNLIENVNGTDGAGLSTDSGPDRVGTQAWTWQHSTIIISTTGSHGLYLENNVDFSSSMVFKDNLILAPSGHTASIVFCAQTPITGWAWTDFDIDYNGYYVTGGGTINFTDRSGSAVSGIANWRTETSQEANSIVTDPEFVGGRDYRLASNGQDALTASSTGGPIGCYVTGSEEIGIRSNPSY